MGIIYSQNNFVYKEVTQAKERQKLTEVLDLEFNTRTISRSLRTNEPSEVVLSFNQEKLGKIISDNSDFLSLRMTGMSGEEIPVSLIKANIFAPDFKASIKDGMTKYDYPVDLENMAFYRGIVDNDAHSLVAISMMDGAIYGFVNSSEYGDLGLRKNDEGQNIMVDLSTLDHSELSCSTKDDGQGYAPEMLRSPGNFRAVGDAVRIYVEVESDVTDWLGGVSPTFTYMTNLFNASAAIYAGDGMEKNISELVINTSLTYFITRGKRQIKPSSASDYLSLFQQAQASSFDGDLAQLVVYNNVGGIAAGFSGICNSNRANSMCMSGFVNDYFFNLQVFAHELGHLFGSRHTHACVWNGNNTAIDGCAGYIEGSCTLPPPAAQDEGTIMSYCYNNYGLDFDEGFHPQPAAVMQNNIAAASCLGPGTGGNTCFDGVQNGDETGIDCGGSCVACPTCNDGIQNGDETGIDCGGSCPDICPEVSCDDPTDLAVTNMKKTKGTNGGQLDWSDIGDANSYDVRIREAGTTAWSTFSATESFIDLQGYGEGVTYEWEVRANCNGSTSNYAGCTFTYQARGADITCGGAGETAFNPFSSGEESLSVIPNPASTNLYLQLDNMNDENHVLDIFNTLGQRVFNANLQSSRNQIEINVEEFEAGIYFISVRSETTKHLKRVVVN